MKKRKKMNTRRLTILGLLTAILLIQNFIPILGNIPIPPINPTIIHVTVIVAALTLGPVDGMIVGGIWGVIRLVRAFAMPATPLDPILWTNPIISIVPRILIGLLAGLSYTFIKRMLPKKDHLSLSIASVIGSLTNTLFVLFFIYIFFTESAAVAMNIDMSTIIPALLVIVGTSGIPEALLAGIVAPLITKPLRKLYKKH